MSRIIFVLLALTISIVASAQSYPKDYFISPVQHPIRLSGSFAELRTNHFHMGIDIKSSKGTVGDPIVAVADGYISRINVDASGFGQAIYIDHDNGYTSVYAHMNSFADSIAAYVKAQQYKLKSFDVNLKLDSTQILVKQGDIIGKLGNRGRSFGPHLHFEIRETKTETPINPFHFGIAPKDNRNPVFQSLKLYDIEGYDILSTLTFKVKAKGGGTYFIADDTIKMQGPESAFAVQVYDQMDGSYNKNGVYKMDVFIDDKLTHGYIMDKVSYDNTHFINACIDYKEKQETKKQYSNCFKYPVDRLNIYNHQDSLNGILQLTNDSVHSIEIVLTDFHENKSTLEFNVAKTSTTITQKQKLENYYLLNEDSNLIKLDNALLVFPKHSFSSSKHIQIGDYKEIVNGTKTRTFVIGESTMPLFRSYQLFIDSIELEDNLKSKLCFVSCNSESKSAIRGKWEQGRYVLKLSSLGEYHLAVDTIAPTIEVVSFPNKSATSKRIAFKIDDNYDVSSRASRLKYEAKIDDQWVLMEYDLKKDLLYTKIDKSLAIGEHKFDLIVLDGSFNKTSFSKNFIIN